LTLSPVLVFGAYIGTTLSHQQGLDASKLFSSLILISLLATPLVRLLQMLPSFGAAKGCFERLDAFLQRPERVDFREIALTPSSSDESIVEAQETANPKLDVTEPPSPGDLAVFVEKADFGWRTEACLRDISLRVRKGDHVAIAGPVGCGKSLLMKALLGEVECTSGTVRIGSARIGYCGQGVWLENATVLENAFRCASDNEEWRRKIIYACALNELLDAQGPSETIGSGGIRLSGGERQRLVCLHASRLKL
jgi:ATP-binding cassette, subfamily C (CFTR/MRP), member 1